MLRGGYPKILAQIYNAQVFPDRILLKESGRLTVPGTQEKYIDIAVAEITCKPHGRIPNKISMNIRKEIAAVACTLHKGDLHGWMLKQDTDQFATGIACTANDPCLNPFHFPFSPDCKS
jgi:hypothetical protein